MTEQLPQVFEVTRRSLLGFAGTGLLIGLSESVAEAQRGSSPVPVRSRIHLGDDGQVTVLAGKIEEGQGARTELMMAAAEELGLPPDRVMVMLADTDMVPDDGVTAGSRTTPSTVPHVRRAAAAIRELLIDTAARQWSTSRDRIQFAEGVVTTGESGRKLAYSDLARLPDAAEHLRQTPGQTALKPSASFRVLGRSHGRHNGPDIVTGKHRFPSDIQPVNTLHGAVLRPPSYEATLLSVDVDALKDQPRVKVIRDGEFVGCVAPTAFEARRASEVLARVAVWREKEGQPSHAEVFDYLKAHARADDGGGRSRPIVTGDVDAALAAATRRAQARYTAAYIQHAPMEPRAAAAEWKDGKATVWTGTSNPFAAREGIARACAVSPDKVRVIVPDMGGGFGGKHSPEAGIEAARLALGAGQPVSLRWTRAEEFRWAYCRPAALVEAEAALDDKNEIIAWRFTNYNSGTSGIAAPYRMANASIRYVPSESPLKQGSYRALAATANNFARECLIDELAASAGEDLLEFRLKRLINDRIREVLLAAARKFNWESRVQQKAANRGIGIACGTEKDSVVAACVEVAVDPKTGTPRVLEVCQAFECGTILNPANLQAQVEGSIVMALGAVLREEIRFADGKLTNPRFSTYRVPRFRDVPKLDIVLVDRKADSVGAGETPMIALAPAVAGAVFSATGKRVRSLPFSTSS